MNTHRDEANPFKYEFSNIIMLQIHPLMADSITFKYVFMHIELMCMLITSQKDNSDQYQLIPMLLSFLVLGQSWVQFLVFLKKIEGKKNQALPLYMFRTSFGSLFDLIFKFYYYYYFILNFFQVGLNMFLVCGKSMTLTSVFFF